LFAEDAAEDLQREKEGMPGMNPVGVAWIETAGRNDAVELRVQTQVLAPRMQDDEEADFSSEVPGVGGNFEHGLSAGAEEKIVEQPWVPPTQRVQLVGQCKDDVEVRYAEQVLFASCQPTVASLRLAFGTVSVAAGVIGR
jgi:hypothetical protein